MSIVRLGLYLGLIGLLSVCETPLIYFHPQDLNISMMENKSWRIVSP